METNPPHPESERQDGAGSRPLQPAKRAGQADRLSYERRRERDRHRLLQMQLEGFGGPTWRDEVQPDVWAYAVRILPKKIRTGEVFTIRARLGGVQADDLVLPNAGINQEDSEDLAAEVAMKAIPVFRDQLERGIWDITKDMSFRSWFVNLCVLRFPAPFRKWLRAQHQHRLVDVDPDVEDTDVFLSPGSIIYVVEFDRYLHRVGDPVTMAMVELDADGFTDGEIAEATRTSIKTVEGRLKKVRRRSRDLRDLEEERNRRRDFGSGVA